MGQSFMMGWIASTVNCDVRSSAISETHFWPQDGKQVMSCSFSWCTSLADAPRPTQRWAGTGLFKPQPDTMKEVCKHVQATFVNSKCFQTIYTRHCIFLFTSHSTNAFLHGCVHCALQPGPKRTWVPSHGRITSQRWYTVSSNMFITLFMTLWKVFIGDRL